MSLVDCAKNALNSDQVSGQTQQRSSLMSPFGYLAEQASRAGNDPTSRCTMTSSIFASVQGDSRMILCVPSVHLTECVVTMIPASD